MRTERFFRYTDYRLGYWYWCCCYAQLRKTNRFCIAHGSKLRLSPQTTVTFGRGVHFNRNFTGDFYGTLIIGENTRFQHDCHISCHEYITIGRHCIIAERVSIHDADHVHTCGSDPIADRGFQTSPVHIGDNVHIGANVVILKGVMIGENAVIGANSVVTHDIAPYTIVAGVPARPIRDMKSV